MKYSIEDTTLTNIANAIRGKVGNTRPVYAEYAINKSGSSTGFDYTSGTYANPYTSTTTINGASYLKIKMAYTARNSSDDAFYVNDVKYSTESYTPSIPELVEFTVSGYSVTFRVELINSAIIARTGWYAEIRGYDENDNIVMVATEETEPNNLTPIQMAEVINNMQEKIPDEAFIISGDCQYKFSGMGWNWFLEQYNDKINTKDITNASNMFCQNAKLKEINFDFNFKSGDSINAGSMFDHCENLTAINGNFNNFKPTSIQSAFNSCRNLRYLPNLENIDFSYHYTNNANCTYLFQNCYSLRSVPETLLKKIYQPKNTGYYYSCLYNTFCYCYVLDEIRGLNPQTGTMKSNMLDSTFDCCFRLKNIIFATQDDGTPYSVNWKSQTINLTEVYAQNKSYILNYNSGITADKEVKDDATYQALKNDPDWFTEKVEYSRYNHESAVATINSLPDTSDYLASAGGTNTVKFKGDSGSATDGGAISSLTPEEIAVATAKGWTVTLV